MFAVRRDKEHQVVVASPEGDAAVSESATLNLIRRRLLDVIDDNHFHRSLRRYQQ
jgi:hypothetical protein